MRVDGRLAGQLRPIEIRSDFLDLGQAHALITWGHTRVLCVASVEERVPPFLEGTGSGWVTAEYSMLPGCSPSRKGREGRGGSVPGRSQEIQRLIGRSLRQAVDLRLLGPRQITVDCDVLQADGGTRTASVTGGWVALALALKKLQAKGVIPDGVLIRQICAVSVGKVGGEVLCDLNYPEDSKAQVDANFVFTGDGAIVEAGGTGEKEPFHRSELLEMLASAESAIPQLLEIQKAAL